MAHVGRKYKLAFRRDVHADLNNDRGYPEAFLATFFNVITSFGNFPVVGPILIINDPHAPAPPMSWFAPNTPPPGQDWSAHLILPVPQAHAGTIQPVQYALTNLVHGEGFTRTGTFLFVFPDSQPVPSLPGTGFTSPGWSWGSGNQGSSFKAATWADYP